MVTWLKYSAEIRYPLYLFKVQQRPRVFAKIFGGENIPAQTSRGRLVRDPLTPLTIIHWRNHGIAPHAFFPHTYGHAVRARAGAEVRNALAVIQGIAELTSPAELLIFLCTAFFGGTVLASTFRAQAIPGFRLLALFAKTPPTL